MSEDPYYTVKAEVQEAVNNADLLYQSWKRILNTVTSLDNEELKRTTEELESTLNGIELDLSDLDGAVNILLSLLSLSCLPFSSYYPCPVSSAWKTCRESVNEGSMHVFCFGDLCDAGGEVVNLSEKHPYPSELKTSLTIQFSLDRPHFACYFLHPTESSLRIIETNPYRFKLDPGEVIGRRTFVEESRKIVKDIRTSIRDPKSHSKFQLNQRSALLNKPSGKYVRLEAELHDDNQRFIERESQQQQMIMSQQDNQLDQVLGTVTTLKELGQTMGRELENQAQMLDEIDHQTDRTGSKLQTAMGKMNKVIQNNADGKSNCCIIVLIIVLLVLLVLVVAM